MQYTCDYCFENFIDERSLHFHKETSLCGLSLGSDSPNQPTTSALNNGFSSPIRHSRFDTNYESLQQRAFHTEKTPLECFISDECFTTEENLIQRTGIHQSSDLFSCSRNPEIKNVAEFHSNSILNTEPRQSFDKFAQDDNYEENHLIHFDDSSISPSIGSNMKYLSCSSNASVENSKNFNHLKNRIWNFPNDDISFATECTNTPAITDKETFTFPAHQNDPNVAVSVLRGSNMDYFSGEVDKFVENSTNLGNFEGQNRNFSNNVISLNKELTNVHLVAEEEALISPVCQRSAVIRHERIHTGERLHPCRFYPKKFMTNSALVRHERIHTGERPFSCRFCTKRFKWQSFLVEHERIHTGERPYACKFCSRTFTRQSNLKRHELVHTSERPYECRLCSRTFTQQSSLKRHERKHTDK